jgi:hypothetical protein
MMQAFLRQAAWTKPYVKLTWKSTTYVSSPPPAFAKATARQAAFGKTSSFSLLPSR